MADRVREFLANKSLLVTGATGFLGKPLVEKLLRAAPDIGQLYLLVRSRRSGKGHVVSAQERFEREIVASGAFDRLREEWRRDFEARLAAKVTVVEGDISKERLGLSEADYARLTETVQVVINSAAVVVFDESPDQAVLLNTLAPRQIVRFAQSCRDAVLMHVSTAYVNGTNPDLAPEALLPTEAALPDGWRGPVLPADLEDEIAYLHRLCDDAEAESRLPRRIHQFRREAAAQMCSDSSAPDPAALSRQVDILRERWVRERQIQLGMERAKTRGWNDTYTFTKALGEQMIAETRGDLPVIIVRPSIIESSLKEPDPGWIDGYRMADPIIIAYGKGRLSDFPADPDIVMDLIPVDYVVNAMLVALPELAAQGGLQVLHVATGTENPLRFEVLYRATRDYFRANPMLDRAGLPIQIEDWSFPTLETFQRRQRWWRLMPLRLATRLLDRLPRNRALRRFRTRLSALQTAIERLYYYTVIYGPYIRRSYYFETRRMNRMYRSLSPEEKASWPFDVAALEWRRYLQDVHIPGLKRNVLKIDPRGPRPPIAEEEILNARERAPQSDDALEAPPESPKDET